MTAPQPVPGNLTPRDVFQRIAHQMVSSLDLGDVLTTITEGLVEELDAAFARIWLIGPGDLCESCFKVDDCEDRRRCLHLEASAGLHTTLNGEYRRVPLGALKIGRIAQGAGPVMSNDIANDPRLPNKDWIAQHQLCSFAGYPLRFRGELLGVVAMFSRHRLTDEQFSHLQIFADDAAVAIKNARLFGELRDLKQRLEAENVYLQEEIKSEHNFEDIIGQSAAIRDVLQAITTVAPTNANVLILGETGVGKELIARAIHARSDRAAMPLIKVNCASIPRELFESEFFGHVRGAFTGAIKDRSGRFQLADRGTLFLDEVGEIPPDMQGKLLRVLQEGEFERIGEERTRKVDVRVIAATNRDLGQEVEAGRFRRDLYYRLNVFPIEVPPLRQRVEDIPLLAAHCLELAWRRLNRADLELSQANVQDLRAYDWPGNVRELQNVIERAVITARHDKLQFDLSPPVGEPAAPLTRDAAQSVTGVIPDAELRRRERDNILAALRKADWRIYGSGGAAELLGVKPTTLASRVKKLGLKRPN